MDVVVVKFSNNKDMMKEVGGLSGDSVRIQIFLKSNSGCVDSRFFLGFSESIYHVSFYSLFFTQLLTFTENDGSS